MNPNRRLLLPLALAALLLTAPRARAEEPSPTRLGVGFHDYQAPIGVRWWLGRSCALDLGLGFQSDKVNGSQIQRYNFQVGVPIVVSRYGRLLAEVRPGIGYRINDTFYWNGTTNDPATDHVIEPRLELEAEVMVIDHLSVSGAFGLVMESTKRGGTNDTDTSVGTIGGDFAHAGIHVYFGGPK
jgi:hypothetical protein